MVPGTSLQLGARFGQEGTELTVTMHEEAGP
jgi:hypothetical protein